MAKLPKKTPTKKKKPKKLEAPRIEEISFPEGYSLAETGTSQSLLQHFLKCRVAYKLALNVYHPIGSRNNTGFGSMTHDVLDKMYSYFKKNGRCPTDDFIGGWVDVFRKQTPEDLEGMSAQEIEWAEGVNYVLLTEYTRYFKTDFEQMKFDEIEVVSESDWEGYRLRRKTDGKFRIHGQKWLMEHKTKGYISEDSLLLQLAFDFQNLFYITCEEIDHPDDPVAGVLYNVIRRPAHMQRKNETLKEFLDRLRGEVKKDPAHFFKRYEIKYTEKDKEQFKKELKIILDEANGCINGKRPLYKNTSACVSAWKCEYLEACSSGKLSGYAQQKFLFPELAIGF